MADWVKIAIAGSAVFWAEEIRKYFTSRAKNRYPTLELEKFFLRHLKGNIKAKDEPESRRS